MELVLVDRRGNAHLQPHQVLLSCADARDRGVKNLDPVRLRFQQRDGSEAAPVLTVVGIVDRPADVSSGSLRPGHIHVHPWILQYFQVLDGSHVSVEAVAEDDTGSRPTHVVLSVQGKFPESTAVSMHSSTLLSRDVSQTKATGGAASQVDLLPESARRGLLDLERAVQRQLRAMPASLLTTNQALPIRLLQELYIFRVERVLFDTAAPELQGLVHLPSIEIAGLQSSATGTSNAAMERQLGDDDSCSGEDYNAEFSVRLWNDGLAGYTNEMKELIFHIAIVLRSGNGTNEAFIQDVGSHGILLSGVHGVGKSLALKAARSELEREGISTLLIDGMSLVMELESSRHPTAYGYLIDKLIPVIPNLNAEPNERSGRSTRAVVFIDDIDILFQSTDGQNAEASANDQRLPPLGSSLLRLLDELSASRANVVIVGASSDEASIPASGRRVGRFEKSIELSVPTEASRKEILLRSLQNFHLIDDRAHSGEKTQMYGQAIDPVATDFSARLASLTGGYIAKDLVRICRNASVTAFSRTSATKITRPGESDGVTWSDLVSAQQLVKPSQLRELNVATPGAGDTTNFVGYEDVKKQLFEFVLRKFHPSAAVQRLQVGDTSGILLHGPSGCGKSLLVKELTDHARVNCVSVKSSELLSKYFGDSEKAIRQLFARARAAAPCLLFFDEFDAIAHKRSFGGGDDSGSSGGVYARMLSTFLNEMDGVGSSPHDSKRIKMGGILVVAATNRMGVLDAALIRPGRIDKTLELGYPTVADTEAILAHYTKKMPLAADVDLHELINRASSERALTGADLSAICKEAAFRALRENLEASEVHMRHFEDAWSHRLDESSS